MKDSLLLGVDRDMVTVPGPIWRRDIAEHEQKGPDRIAFMTEAHHLVRDYVVRELPRYEQPLSPEMIAKGLVMSVEEVIPILEDLERHLTFLYRNEAGAVVWAYPVTASQTPHRITLRSSSSSRSSEKLYAA